MDDVSARIAVEKSIWPEDTLHHKQLDGIRRSYLARKRAQTNTFKQHMLGYGMLTEEECETFEYEHDMPEELQQTMSQRCRRKTVENKNKQDEARLEAINAAFSNPWLK